MNPKKFLEKKPSSNYMKFSSLGFQMIVTIGLGAWAGVKLDKHYQTKTPWFTLALTLWAVIGSMVYFIIQAKRITDDQNNQN